MPQLRIFTTLLTLLSVAMAVAPAQAQLLAQNPSAQNGDKIPTGTVGKLVKELNLTPGQIQRLQKLRTDTQGKTKERRQALRIAKQELAQSIQGNASTEQIRQKHQQVQVLQKEVADEKFERTLAIREILTPEQRVKLFQLMAQRHQNRGRLK